jgi:putative membrane protein
MTVLDGSANGRVVALYLYRFERFSLNTISHLGESCMKLKLVSFAASAAMAVAFSAAPLLAADNSNNTPSPEVTSLLNKANHMNLEEQDMANLLHSKAGDNQALMTMADTMNSDHKANEDAVKALANQMNVNLQSSANDSAVKDRLSNLDGAAFNRAFLEDTIKDHRQAIEQLKSEREKLGSQDRDIKVYLDETIPVLESHLRLAENMQRDSRMLGSPENPSNNKTNTSSKGSSGNPS